MASWSSRSSAPAPIPYVYKSTDYTLLLSAEHHRVSTASSALRAPGQLKASINLQVHHSCRWCSRSQRGRLTIDRSADLSLSNLSFQGELLRLLFPDGADEAARTMLGEAFINPSPRERTFLARYISTFARYAAIEAAKRIDVGELALTIKIGACVIMHYDEEGAIADAVKDSRVEAAPFKIKPSSASASAMDERAPDESCSVCLEDFCYGDGVELACMPCSHVFHRKCIQQWTERSASCPMCRSVV